MNDSSDAGEEKTVPCQFERIFIDLEAVDQETLRSQHMKLECKTSATTTIVWSLGLAVITLWNVAMR